MSTWWRERNNTSTPINQSTPSSVEQLFAANVREFLKGQHVVDLMNYLRTNH